MKSEHRHQLAENDLEHRLGELAEKLKPYTKHILFGTLGVSVVAIVAALLFQNANADSGNAWSDFTRCENANQYIEVAEQYPGTSVSHWANVTAGEMLLRAGVELAFSNRPVAVSDLEKARDAFNAVINDSTATLEVRERALNGLARTLEALCDGDTQPAIEAYERIIQEFPDSRHRRWAEDRVQALKQGATQEFYAWFDERNPNPADRPTPGDTGSSSAVDPHAGLEGLGPFLDPSMRILDTPTDPGTASDSETGEMEAPGSTDGEPMSDGASSESGETADGPSLGPAPPATGQTESNESTESAPEESGATSETSSSAETPADETTGDRDTPTPEESSPVEPANESAGDAEGGNP